MTDQCFDEPDRGREPEPAHGHNFTYSYPIYSLEWYRDNATVLHNTAAKLELAKKALDAYANELHECNSRQLPTTSVYIRVKNILKQLED